MIFKYLPTLHKCVKFKYRIIFEMASSRKNVFTYLTVQKPVTQHCVFYVFLLEECTFFSDLFIFLHLLLHGRAFLLHNFITQILRYGCTKIIFLFLLCNEMFEFEIQTLTVLRSVQTLGVQKPVIEITVNLILMI